MKYFETAEMDKWTTFYTLLFVFISLGTLLLVYQSNAPVFVYILLISILSIAFVTSYLLKPKLTVEDQNILVKNTFVDFKIPLSQIKHIEKIEKLGFNIRTLGVGGVFGYFGYFNGNDVWYVTNSYKKVKITINSGKIYMFSPENPEEFIQYITNLKSKI